MWILGTVLGVLLFFVLLLAIPVDVVFYVEKEEEFKSRTTVKWLFGLVGKDIGGRKQKPAREKPAKEKGKKKRSIRPLLAMLRSRGFLRRVLRLFRDMLRRTKVRELKLDVRVGLSDPADTGLLFAAIGPMAGYLTAFTPLDVEVQPDFEQETLRGHFRSDIRILPIQFVLLFILFALSPTTLRALWAMAAAGRK